MEWILIGLSGGVAALLDYLSAHVLLCLVPAFFIAGAISALLPKELVTRYLGKGSPLYVSYPLAAAAGLLIAVCSCTILPLFAGIYKRGAGLGPAVTFLFIGPAINILAITYTGVLIGMEIAVARAVLAVAFGILIGMIMAVVFRERKSAPSLPPIAGGSPEAEVRPGAARPVETVEMPKGVLTLLILLGLVLVTGTAPVTEWVKYPLLSLLVIGTAVCARNSVAGEDVKAWLGETLRFVKMIFPLLLVGVFAAGALREFIPSELIETYVGNNGLGAITVATFFGVFMYFPTLVEVPIARMFMDLGMAKGPLLAYLLADPELSIQSVLVTAALLGRKKIAVYVVLVALFSIAAGYIFGNFWGLLF